MKILIAEDEKAMSDALAMVLRHFGYEVDTVYDGEAAVEKGKTNVYDCMVFDVMMPRMDGVEALRTLRQSGDTTPVLLLTAKAEIDDRITGLDAGADDYLTKPFAMGELLARIRSMTRRAGDFTPSRLQAGSVTLDVEEQELSAGSAVRLGGKETKLMRFLMMNEGKALSTGEILRHVWKDEPDAGEETVWMYISYLKEKLEAIRGDVEIRGDEAGPFTLARRGAD